MYLDAQIEPKILPFHEFAIKCLEKTRLENLRQVEGKPKENLGKTGKT